MRITNLMLSNSIVENMQSAQSQIYKLQEQVDTGKQFQTPSENPMNASAAIKLKSALTVSAGYQKTASLVSDWMSTTDGSLGQLEDIANNAVNLVLTGLNDTSDATDRNASMATELTSMISQAVDLANSKYADSYIFSGVNVNQQAFTLTGTSTLTYNGTSKDMTRSVGQNSKVVLNINGDEAISPLIQAMITARDNLTANNTTDLPTSLQDLQTALTTLSAARTENGARQRQVDTVISSMENSDLSLKALLIKKEDTDTAEATVLLENQKTVLQAVLEVGSRTISALNLFDYLQN